MRTTDQRVCPLSEMQGTWQNPHLRDAPLLVPGCRDRRYLLCGGRPFAFAQGDKPHESHSGHITHCVGSACRDSVRSREPGATDRPEGLSLLRGDPSPSLRVTNGIDTRVIYCYAHLRNQALVHLEFRLLSHTPPVPCRASGCPQDHESKAG